jgi:hypothetical protein
MHFDAPLDYVLIWDYLIDRGNISMTKAGIVSSPVLSIVSLEHSIVDMATHLSTLQHPVPPVHFEHELYVTDTEPFALLHLCVMKKNYRY